MSHQKLVGQQAPAITLPNYDGESFTLTPGAKGIPTVLFFYPKAGSYGCTKEACQFRNAIAEKPTFHTDKVEIVGISHDTVEKQKAFVEKNKLTYPVLSDTNGEATKAYNVGKGLFGLAEVARVTFIVDGKGVVRDSVEGTLNYGAHSKFVAKWLEKLEAEKEKPAEAATEPTETTEPAPEPAAEPTVTA
ncbi:Peroxiredoxin Q [Mycena indigotica]|uniref:thioredoxin-dependent peroxiredoxin n=1 Tax=Mycena indigotica TaxID=2126181 RepID=A0A8H6SHS4_9AGAR|nr:Peroxiredoxin Q [Mycena indigotica]KAF7299107.1 Peroxiredoxin Q [Mycena indigotica]